MTAPPGFMRRTFRLEFEDPSFNGLDVRARSADLRYLLRFEELMATDFALRTNAEEYDEFCGMLSQILISWNLLDDAERPVPTDADSVSKEEWPLLKQIARAWIGAVASVAPPLPKPSSDGDLLAGLNIEIPMETLPG